MSSRAVCPVTEDVCIEGCLPGGCVRQSQTVQPVPAKPSLVDWALGQDLKPTAKLLLIVGCHMSTKAENAVHYFDPTIDELAARCGVTRMTVFATIRKLEKAGLLRVERFPGDRNVYLPQMGAGAKQ